METLTVRLVPGDDLKRSLTEVVADEGVRAGVILTAVGSLTQARLRFAGRADGVLLGGTFEILSLVGTLSPEGLHLHLAIADVNGVTTGGHLLDGSVVRTTAELVLGVLPGLEFMRVDDDRTGHRELRVNRVAQSPGGD